MKVETKIRIADWLYRNRKKLLRLPAGIPLLYLLYPIIIEIASGNLMFLREWILIDKYYIATIIQMFVGPNQLYLWLHFLAIFLLFLIVVLILKMAIWNRIFPIMVLKNEHSYKEELRVYWYTNNFFERKYAKWVEQACMKYEPKNCYIWVNGKFFLNPFVPHKSMIKIKIPDESIILDRTTHELIVQDTGIIYRVKDSEWELSWDRTHTNKVESAEIFQYIEDLLVEMTDKTSKAAKSDPHIRKKVIMDSTYTQASSIAPQLKKLIKEIRGEKDEK